MHFTDLLDTYYKTNVQNPQFTLSHYLTLQLRRAQHFITLLMDIT